jgi:hypothetical protein
MAENTIEKKFFLDWAGLKKLWSKINETFANKVEVNSEFESVRSNILTLTGEFNTFSGTVTDRIDGVEGTIETFMPREFPTYTDAVKGAGMLAPGTIVKVEEDSQLLDEAGEPVDDKVYAAGLYIVLDPETGLIEKVSTASGAGVGGNIEELATSLEKLDSEVIKGAAIINELNETLSVVEKVGNNLVFKIDDTFDVNTESVNALTHRAIAAMFGTLSSQISQIPKFKISIVDELPTSEISLSTIYLVKNSDPSSNNLYAEYIYVEKDASYEWEKLGEQSLVIEDFATKKDVELAIAAAMQNVVSKDDLSTALTTAKGEILDEVSKTYISKIDVEKFIDQDELNAELNNYYNKSEADGKFLTQNVADTIYAKLSDIDDFMTESEIIASIQEGNIGENIRITDDQINSLTTE